MDFSLVRFANMTECTEYQTIGLKKRTKRILLQKSSFDTSFNFL